MRLAGFSFTTSKRRRRDRDALLYDQAAKIPGRHDPRGDRGVQSEKVRRTGLPAAIFPLHRREKWCNGASPFFSRGKHTHVQKSPKLLSLRVFLRRNQIKRSSRVLHARYQTRFQRSCAHVYSFRFTVNENAYFLYINTPLTAGSAHGVRACVASFSGFAGDIASACHDFPPPLKQRETNGMLSALQTLEYSSIPPCQLQDLTQSDDRRNHFTFRSGL